MEEFYPWNRKSIGDPKIKKPEVCISCGAIITILGWTSLPDGGMQCNVCRNEIFGSDEERD